ncbi:glycosyltransferase involved in cell wall biosynthesis/SAM-dependent methyltransferase [Catalinimonas alkaloidigena]|uniref:glycosyltransferase n=1 Tax=Catalinimonas alkaloidigena TaxID=1075417 RepID=UPI0024057764|nr:glycosyltransferase [Catalinimonas alkaloidigena]MDF9801102.1 glycosyltransferase involved in cell wall biosynthesis/SAM-dependent methyltransferase [Catalinimonas alkaloidigena]
MNLNPTPLVSVCCITYNQESFIRKAIESFLMQKTNFDIEVIIHDDASTDNTSKIIREYEEKYPHIIKPIYQTENQWSKGIRPSPTFVWPKAKGKYIALCEGDDYWTDPLKLQKQVDFLESNTDYVICLHNSYLRFEGTNKPDKIAINHFKEELILKDFIDVDYFREKKGLVSRGHTSSILFKNNLIKKFPDWYYHKAVAGDIYLLILLAQYGKGRFINEFMSVYRINQGGITRAHSTQKGHLLHRNRMSMLGIINEHFDYKYDKLIREQTAKFHLAEAQLYIQEHKYLKAISHFWHAVIHSQDKPSMLKSIILLFGKSSKVMRIFLGGFRKVKSLLKGRKKKAEKKKNRIQVSQILASQHPPENYDDHAVFQQLQSKYSPRTGYKYDYYHSWERGIKRASAILEIPTLQQKGLKFLEVACGDAMTSYVLSTYGHEGHCHDIEDWRLPEAKGLEFYQADLNNSLPIEDSQFDLIFSFNAFEHLPDPAFALQEISRVAKPGAIVYIEFGPLYNSPWGLHAYRTLYMPYPQFLFSESFYMDKLQELGMYDLGKKQVGLQPMNKWDTKAFESIWELHDLRVEDIKYGSDTSHLDIILKYPLAFRGRKLDLKEVTTSWMRAILSKKQK